MKKILLAAFGAAMAFGTVQAQDPLSAITVETFYVDDSSVAGYPAGASTYRIYAEMEDATDFVSAVYGNGPSNLHITSTTTIWNTALGGVTGKDLNAAFFGIAPEVEYDSMVTIGMASNADAGDVSQIAALPSSSAISDVFGGSAALSTMTIADGSWFTTNGQPNGLGDPLNNNRVLLAQITTTGTLSYELNMQVFDDGLGANTYFYLWNGASEVVPGVPGTYDGYCKGLSSASVGDSACDPVGGCLDSTACNFNPDADFDDSSCIFAPCSNDDAATAVALTAYPFGSGVAYNDNTANAQFISVQSTCAVTNDLWYSFVAPTGGITVTVAGAASSVELQDINGNSIECEDAVPGIGTEVLNVGGLTAGATYFVSVSTAVDSFFDIWVEYHAATVCDYPEREYLLCETFKADWVGGVEYNFHFTSGSGEQLSSTGFGLTRVQLYKVPGMVWTESYSVLIDVTHQNFDGVGNLENIVVPGISSCNITTGYPPLATVRDQYTCSNGQLWMGDWLRATPWACGATDWSWRFVNTTGQELPIEATSGGAVDRIRLRNVNGLVEGQDYNVAVHASFADGSEANYHTAKCISLYGVINAPMADMDAAEAENLKTVAAEAALAGAAVYPNPSNGDYIYLNVTDVDAEKVLVDVYDMVGNVVYSEQIAATGSNLNTFVSFNQSLASGVYMVQINVNGNVQTERLVVEK